MVNIETDFQYLTCNDAIVLNIIPYTLVFCMIKLLIIHNISAKSLLQLAAQVHMQTTGGRLILSFTHMQYLLPLAFQFFENACSQARTLERKI